MKSSKNWIKEKDLKKKVLQMIDDDKSINKSSIFLVLRNAIEHHIKAFTTCGTFEGQLKYVDGTGNISIKTIDGLVFIQRIYLIGILRFD
jgi:hypothetical protein